MSETNGRIIATAPKIRLHVLKRFAIWEWAIVFIILFFLTDKYSELHREIGPTASAVAYITLYLFTITKTSFPKSIAWTELSVENASKIKILVGRRYKDLLFYVVYSFLINLKYPIILYIVFKFTIPAFDVIDFLSPNWAAYTSGLLLYFLHFLTGCFLLTVAAIAIQLIFLFTKGAILKPLYFISSLLDRLSKQVDELQEL